jgi:hypothetical protein
MKIKWLGKPRKEDYSAAAIYLSLTMTPSAAKSAARRMQNARISTVAAKGIFRASGLSLLGVSDSHVEKDIGRISKKEKLPPLLLYRDKINNKLIIADGYHRLCAVYKLDEDAMIPCKIV